MSFIENRIDTREGLDNAPFQVGEKIEIAEGVFTEGSIFTCYEIDAYGMADVNYNYTAFLQEEDSGKCIRVVFNTLKFKPVQEPTLWGLFGR